MKDNKTKGMEEKSESESVLKSESESKSESEFEESITERTKLGRQEKSNKQNPEGQGLKILTPDQMLIRLPISLKKLKAGNNSEKLKTEIRQLLYSLYHSTKLTKAIYNNLISTT